MIDGFNVSLAGLNVFSRQLETIANNTANVNTDGYKAQKATIKEDKEGGPELTISLNTTPGIPIQVPDSPVRETSNVDLSGEMPNLLVARKGYEANLKVLKTEEELSKSALDLLA